MVVVKQTFEITPLKTDYRGIFCILLFQFRHLIKFRSSSMIVNKLRNRESVQEQIYNTAFTIVSALS